MYPFSSAVLSLVGGFLAAPATGQTGQAPPSGGEARPSGITEPALEFVSERVHESRTQFFLYEDQDSGSNHGFFSGKFSEFNPQSLLDAIHVNTGCIDEDMSPTGCTMDSSVLDRKRGTVVSITLPSLIGTNNSYVGLAIEEPEGWAGNPRGLPLDLSGATAIEFWARSPNGAKVKFGVNGFDTQAYYTLSTGWTFITLALTSPPFNGPMGLPLPLTNVRFLFSVTKDLTPPYGDSIVLLDDIRFTPVPTSQAPILSLPRATTTYGVVPRPPIFGAPGAGPCVIPIPPDQAARNFATTYESSLAIMAFADRGTLQDIEDLTWIADGLDYALMHDIHGHSLPVSARGGHGLHNTYMCGHLPLYNDQKYPGTGWRGDVRLAGFTVGPSFYIAGDGATGGNNAFAILALLRAYDATGATKYLDDAQNIGVWIVDKLEDPPAMTNLYGGYLLGYDDVTLTPSCVKSTENNADIYAAFIGLAQAVPMQAAYWTGKAQLASEFCLRMYDRSTKLFYTGTRRPGCTAQEEINPLYTLDATSFTLLALAKPYASVLNWQEPAQAMATSFDRTIDVGSGNVPVLEGFSIDEVTVCGPDGIAWEFTGQMPVVFRWADRYAPPAQNEALATFYQGQLALAQHFAPFTNRRGVVASTMTNAMSIHPYKQCLQTPFQCIPERVGLAATLWAVFAEQDFNPLAP